MFSLPSFVCRLSLTHAHAGIQKNDIVIQKMNPASLIYPLNNSHPCVVIEKNRNRNRNYLNWRAFLKTPEDFSGPKAIFEIQSLSIRDEVLSPKTSAKFLVD